MIYLLTSEISLFYKFFEFSKVVFKLIVYSHQLCHTISVKIATRRYGRVGLFGLGVCVLVCPLRRYGSHPGVRPIARLLPELSF